MPLQAMNPYKDDKGPVGMFAAFCAATMGASHAEHRFNFWVASEMLYFLYRSYLASLPSSHN
eukprot:852456-Amphidinium_carterae.1